MNDGHGKHHFKRLTLLEEIHARHDSREGRTLADPGSRKKLNTVESAALSTWRETSVEGERSAAGRFSDLQDDGMAMFYKMENLGYLFRI